MDAGFFKEWAGLIAVLISLLATLYAWLTSKAKVNAEHLKGVDRTLTNHDKRLSHIETEMTHLPAKDDVTELKLSLAELRGTVGRLDETVSSVGRTVHRIDDYLREHKGQD